MNTRKLRVRVACYDAPAGEWDVQIRTPGGWEGLDFYMEEEAGCLAEETIRKFLFGHSGPVTEKMEFIIEMEAD